MGPEWRALGSLVGLSIAGVIERLGEPRTRRPGPDEEWLVFEDRSGTVLIRCAGRSDASGLGGPGERGSSEPETVRVRSWSFTFADPPATLRTAAERFGLWPACAPDESPGESAAVLIRRVIPESPGGRRLSLTATIRGGRIFQLALFDEEPDWL